MGCVGGCARYNDFKFAAENDFNFLWNYWEWEISDFEVGAQVFAKFVLKF